MQKVDIIAEVEDLGNNKWIVFIEGESFHIYSPNEATAKARAIQQFIQS
jgi:hypothetical protein